jgi:NAD(P)-dependent dehydrogenase (short-subunit alcohol dehydrogenase family)
VPLVLVSRTQTLLICIQDRTQRPRSGQEHKPYRAWRAYGQSKLANLLFTAELQRRLTAAGSTVLATAAHPGYAATADIPGDSFAGPGGFMEQRGAPKLVGRTNAAKDVDVARRLWDVSEELTGVRFRLHVAAAV